MIIYVFDSINRRSDTDVFLDEISDYTSGEYEDRSIDTPIDYIEVFPDGFRGSPNITVTPDGRRFEPRYNPGIEIEVEDEYFDEPQYNSNRGSSSSFVRFASEPAQVIIFNQSRIKKIS